jgi:ppGpp synthetase/RelA/SpoT-type nucleotidyltranferase
LIKISDKIEDVVGIRLIHWFFGKVIEEYELKERQLVLKICLNYVAEGKLKKKESNLMLHSVSICMQD